MNRWKRIYKEAKEKEFLIKSSTLRFFDGNPKDKKYQGSKSGTVNQEVKENSCLMEMVKEARTLVGTKYIDRREFESISDPKKFKWYTSETLSKISPSKISTQLNKYYNIYFYYKASDVENKNKKIGCLFGFTLLVKVKGKYTLCSSETIQNLIK